MPKDPYKPLCSSVLPLTTMYAQYTQHHATTMAKGTKARVGWQPEDLRPNSISCRCVHDPNMLDLLLENNIDRS